MNVVIRSARSALLTALFVLTLGTGAALGQDFTVNLKDTDIQEDRTFLHLLICFGNRNKKQTLEFFNE